MRFKIDENLHDEVALLLERDGHEAHTVHAENLRGCDDEALSRQCAAEDRILVTLDLDFADLRSFPPSKTAGIIVLRVRSQSRAHILQVMARILALLRAEPIAQRLWIVTEWAVRIRGD